MMKKIKPMFLKKLIGKGKENESLVTENKIQIQSNSLNDILNQCKIDKTLWDVDDYNVKQLSSGGFLWTVYFKKNKPTVDFEKLKIELRASSPRIPKISYPPTNKNLLLECSIFDTHLAKLCYPPEVGQDYNIKIAYDLFSKAIDYSINSVKNYNIEKVLFIIGQDFLHVDGKNNLTTAGTPQDSDSRFTKIFTTGRKLLIESIEKLKTVAPVDIICAIGNHEENSMFHLADCIECRYWNDENVVVNNSPMTRKYYQWGKNLIGVTHGDKVKIMDLALLMANEEPKLWAATTYRYWRLGHWHHQKMWIDEKTGVIIEVLPAVSSADSWHSAKGFVNNIRGAVSSIYDKDHGLINKFYYNI